MISVVGLTLAVAPLLQHRIDPPLPLIPYPASVERLNSSFAIPDTLTTYISTPTDPALARLAALAGEVMQAEMIRTNHQADAGLQLRLVDDFRDPDPEGYELEIGTERVVIRASATAGLFYGIQTLRQLLPEDGSRELPGVRIADSPRFTYRGMHLDIARHFFDVNVVKRYVDLISMHKFNVFHWHLTEDQGWRIEIKKYPLLTEVGSRRAETIVEKNFDPFVGDGTPYGGFYTQDEIREVVSYAAERYVTVIPEIEMPGHSLAALASYPELACTEGPFEVGTRWGVYEDIYCPSERTFAFLQDVLAEVLELFPSRYIHIGGDEAPKARWRESALAQEVMEREGLGDEGELQSYFIRRMERWLIAHGRRLIGWDEILEGGLAPEATVMSWRGMDGGIAAARQGHDVIMTPGSHVYFDHYQGDRESEPLAIGGFTPLEKVYSFEPVPDVLSATEAEHILGAQGNVWTEYIATPEHLEYMAFPRALALAEVVWSPRHLRDWRSFRVRLSSRLAELARLGVNYREPPEEELAGGARP